MRNYDAHGDECWIEADRQRAALDRRDYLADQPAPAPLNLDEEARRVSAKCEIDSALQALRRGAKISYEEIAGILIEYGESISGALRDAATYSDQRKQIAHLQHEVVNLTFAVSCFREAGRREELKAAA